MDACLKDEVSAAEALWMFKVAHDDLSLADCDGAPALFQCMFSNSGISKALTYVLPKNILRGTRWTRSTSGEVRYVLKSHCHHLFFL